MSSTRAWLRDQVATEGGRVRAGDTDEATAAADITAQAFLRDGAAMEIVTIAIAKQIRSWLAKHNRAGTGQMLLFDDLPPQLEIAPGRFVAQPSMTGPDWDAALKQAETKESNAAGFAAEVRAAYKAVRHLLSDDSSVKTADVQDRLAEQRQRETGS